MTVETIAFDNDVLQEWYNSHPNASISRVFIDTGRIMIAFTE